MSWLESSAAGLRRIVPGFLVLLLALPAAALGAEWVRVVKDDAALRLNPESTSVVLVQLKIGTVVEVTRKQGPWYAVILPPDNAGLRRSGFVSSDDVEPYEMPEAGGAGQSAAPAVATPPLSQLLASSAAPAARPRPQLAPDWQDRYDAATSKRNIGILMMIAGVAVEGLSFAVSNRDSYGELDYSNRYMVLALGAAISIPGGFMIDRGNSQRRQLQDEKRRAQQGHLQQRVLIQASKRPGVVYQLTW